MASFLARNLAILGVLLAVPLVADELWAFQLALYLVYAIAALGVGVAWGQASILSLGQGLFVGLAAYLVALGLLATGDPVLSYAFVPGAALLAGAFAYLLGIVIFRGRTESGPAFSLITLALALSGFQIANGWSSVTGGFNGLVGIPSLPGLGGIVPNYLLVAVALALSVALADWLVRAPVGTLWRAIAQNERRLAFFGYSTPRLKAAAFAVAGALAGLSGALYAPQQNLVAPDLTGFAFSGSLVVFAAVGGRFTVLGPVIGALVVGVLSAELRDRVPWWELVVALFFILVVLRFPGGLMQIATRFGHSPTRRVGTPSATVVAPRPAGGPALSVAFRDVRVRLGDVTILDGLSVATGEERTLCIIGPNGAGKTSTLNVLTGALPKSGGEILVGERAVPHPTPTAIARRGVGRKFQTPSVFPDLTVGENFAIALWSGRVRWWDLLRPSLFGWTSPMLSELQARFPFLAETERLAAELPHGGRQILELAMALCTEPRLLLLDEPCAGLSHEETASVIALIGWVQRAFDLRVVIVEHDMDLVRRLADRVVVLHQGRLLASGTVEAVQADPAVRAVYVGGQR